MIKLTEYEKKELEDFKRSKAYEILKRIEKEQNDYLYERLATFNIDDAKDREEIRRQQIYKKARDDFFLSIEDYIKKAYTPVVTGQATENNLTYKHE